MTSNALSKMDGIQVAYFEILLLSFVPEVNLIVAIAIGFLCHLFDGQCRRD